MTGAKRAIGWPLVADNRIGGLVLAIPVGAVAVLVVAAIIAIGSALNGIYRAALYRFAAEGAATGAFSDDLIRNAFVAKKGR